jgi:hypothetical protein
MVMIVLSKDKHNKNEYYKNTIYYRAFEGMNPTLEIS